MGVHLFAKAFKEIWEALPVLLYPLITMTLFFSLGIYIAEPRDNISSLGESSWLTIVTMTTVGYGDVTPVSMQGALLVSILVISSVLYMAMPLGIMGSTFTRIW